MFSTHRFLCEYIPHSPAQSVLGVYALDQSGLEVHKYQVVVFIHEYRNKYLLN